jgi:benzylsuccinate CoA-transferase BbsF subunit
MTGALDGIKVLEFGAGAAGPLATRYLADHGATVVRVESRVRPDFLRLYGITATQKSLDASPMFAAFNCNKLAITLNMKHPDARAIALRLVRWADVVAENFAPGAMGRWGLGYEDLAKEKPDLVMVSTCLHGQTGPERDYPGFGGQGAAISGFNHMTGWSDREPLGPYGTITDSLSPRFAAAAVMAALLRRNRTGEGTYLDLSQVECAIYCLGPELVEQAVTGVAPSRRGNRSGRAAPHGVFRCAGEDRWIAIAVWSDEEWATLASTLSLAPEESWQHLDGRLAQPDQIEAAVDAATSTRDRDQLADQLRLVGLEATAVLDLADLNGDEQLQHRGHFVPLSHPVIGSQNYETLGIRLADSPPAFTRPGPTLGRDNEEVYKGILGMSDDEFKTLEAAGAFE